MKYPLPLLALLLTLSTNAQGAESSTRPQLQEEFLTWKFGMFIHFNMATYHDRQWALGYEDPSTFRPDQLDCNQWARAADFAGMKYAVLTVKHTGGWCLWDSKHTASHDMTAFVNYKDGKGDIVREFIEACRKHDIKVGLYYCLPRDFSRGEHKENSLRGLPPEAKGNYVAFVKDQITEILTQYGPIDLLWFDQYQFDVFEHWQEIFDHVKSHQPNCLIIANNSIDLKETDIHSYEYPWLKAQSEEYFQTNQRTILPPEDNTVPAEVCDKLGPGWFWMSDREWKLRGAEEVVEMLRLCNSRKSNYLLNVAPDRSGLIPESTVERLREIGQLCEEAN